MIGALDSVTLVVLIYHYPEAIMSAIIKETIKGHVYLYESESYRDEKGQPRSKRILIGKIDPETGAPTYKQEYIERMDAEGKTIDDGQYEKRYSKNDVKHSRIKELGASYLYTKIAERIGLLEVLRESLPDYWQQIFTLACFLVSNDDPMMYCADWVEKTDGLPQTAVSASSVSRLFQEITLSDRNSFFVAWNEILKEKEYMALDITSISTYSEFIKDAEWGHNRDNESLPQINLCLLMGEQSRLPVYHAVYSGSLTDVSTLKTTLESAASLSLSKITAVMDKGFYKATNVNDMMSDQSGIRFLMAVPFSNDFAKKLVVGARQSIDLVENNINVGDDSVLGVAKEQPWGGVRTVNAHIFYNVVQAAIAKRELYSQVSSLAQLAKAEPKSRLHRQSFKKYLDIKNPGGAEYSIQIRQDVVDEELANKGWLVTISNNIKDAAEAIRIYRAKDVVEKGFYRLKNSLELGRLRVHSDEAMQNKIFVGFIALILMSHIHSVMLDQDLYLKMTMKKLILIMEKIRVVYIKDDRILMPVTKEQSDILRAFKLPPVL